MNVKKIFKDVGKKLAKESENLAKDCQNVGKTVFSGPQGPEFWMRAAKDNRKFEATLEITKYTHQIENKEVRDKLDTLARNLFKNLPVGVVLALVTGIVALSASVAVATLLKIIKKAVKFPFLALRQIHRALKNKEETN